MVSTEFKTQPEFERISESKKPQDNSAGVMLENEKAELELMKKNRKSVI